MQTHRQADIQANGLHDEQLNKTSAVVLSLKLRRSRSKRVGCG